jgi:glycosyltransferase involved in cell wall biosynthesis
MAVKESPKVSVIMPIYNGERYVEQAIDSLLAQTYQDWELIVVDDGSTDSTPSILNRYTDPRIRVIQQKNGGEANARNTGLDSMKGEYMAFLDADDIYFPNALADLSSFLDSNQRYGVVFSDGIIFDQNDNELMRLTEVRPGIHTGNILDPLVLSPSVITVPVCTMSRVADIRRNELHFDENNNLIGTDWDFWIRLSVNVEFGYLDRITCKYRIHTSNITRTVGSEKRRRDHTYRRLKIMNAEWFGRLSQQTRGLFFLELLTVTLSGDFEKQSSILESRQFAQLPASKRADLWRLVGVDCLKNSQDLDRAKLCLKKAFELNPGDRKTRFLHWSLMFGKLPALASIELWHSILQLRKKLDAVENTPSEHLQKLLGVR